VVGRHDGPRAQGARSAPRQRGEHVSTTDRASWSILVRVSVTGTTSARRARRRDGGSNDLSHSSAGRGSMRILQRVTPRTRRELRPRRVPRSAIALTSPRGRVGLATLVVPELETALVHVNRSPLVGAH